jgi:plastocyanin
MKDKGERIKRIYSFLGLIPCRLRRGAFHSLSFFPYPFVERNCVMKVVKYFLAGMCFMIVSAIAVQAGDLKGTIKFSGKAPAMREIKMNGDRNCAQMHHGPVYSEDVIVNKNGTLKNVFVYLKEGVKGKYPVPSSPVVLTQEGCMYHPHIFGIQVGQPLEIVNDDPTLHNIHALPKENIPFNVGQPLKGMKTTKSFDKPEVMVKFKCDVHNWMSAYCGVLDHPFFAVSDENGNFDIKNVPPGTYTVEAWHEKYGVQDMKVTVTAKGAAVNFMYPKP